MKFGLGAIQSGHGADGDGAAKIAVLAEELGFESLWTTEHIVVPEKIDSVYPFAPSGKMEAPADTPRPSPLLWLTYAAAVTSTVTFGTGILLINLRNPVMLAKETATLDRLSGGRLMLGVGIGWMKEEFALMNTPWERRGARAEDYMAALRELWQPGARSHHGEFISFDRVHCSPTPVNNRVPIIVSGASRAAAVRAGRYGDGFYPLVPNDETHTELVTLMREEAAEAGRDPEEIEVTVQGPADAGHIDRMRRLGVDRYIVFPPAERLPDNPDRLPALAKAIGLNSDNGKAGKRGRDAC